MTSKRISILIVLLLFATLLKAQQSENKDIDSQYKIAYSSDESNYPCIYYTDEEGKKKLKITNRKLRDGYPHCSPDGKRIVFYGYYDEGKTWSIHTMNIDGSDRKRLTDSSYIYDSDPVWSHDGKYIAFTRSDSEWKTSRLWIMNADGSNCRRIGDFNGLSPCFTKEGGILFYSAWDDSGEICITDINGSKPVPITNNSFRDSKPRISPDGTKILFTSNRNGKDDIFVMDIDGSNQIGLTSNHGKCSGPRWSPDGMKIVFVSDYDGDYDICIMNNDGSSIKKITKNDSQDIQPTWLYLISNE